MRSLGQQLLSIRSQYSLVLVCNSFPCFHVLSLDSTCHWTVLNKMHSFLSLRTFVICLSLTLSPTFASRQVSRRPAKRSYSTHDYYVLEHDPSIGISPQDCADAFGAELVEPAGALQDHWLLRVRKGDPRGILADVLPLSKRDALSRSVRRLTRQVPRQRIKRAAIPAPPPTPAQESGEKSLARNIAQRLGIEDPLFKDQWHLVNEDYPQHMMNATPVWEMGITGKGVISCLVDDGLDFESDDLADNFVSNVTPRLFLAYTSLIYRMSTVRTTSMTTLTSPNPCYAMTLTARDVLGRLPP